MYLHMLDIVDTYFSCERELIVCSFLQDFSKGKGSSLQVICYAHAVFLPCGTEVTDCTSHRIKLYSLLKLYSRHLFCKQKNINKKIINFAKMVKHHYRYITPTWQILRTSWCYMLIEILLSAVTVFVHEVALKLQKKLIEEMHCGKTKKIE